MTAGEMLQAARAAIEAAQGKWTGADWTHEAGERDGETLYCEGGTVDGCETCESARVDAALAEEAAERALSALSAGNYARALDEIADAASMEGNYGDCPTWRASREAVEALEESCMRCQCGEITGVRCDYIGLESQMALVTYVPPMHRGTAETLGSWAGLSRQAACSAECAESLSYLYDDGRTSTRDPWIEVEATEDEVQS